MTSLDVCSSAAGCEETGSAGFVELGSAGFEESGSAGFEELVGSEGPVGFKEPVGFEGPEGFEGPPGFEGRFVAPIAGFVIFVGLVLEVAEGLLVFEVEELEAVFVTRVDLVVVVVVVGAVDGRVDLLVVVVVVVTFEVLGDPGVTLGDPGVTLGDPGVALGVLETTFAVAVLDAAGAPEVVGLRLVTDEELVLCGNRLVDADWPIIKVTPFNSITSQFTCTLPEDGRTLSADFANLSTGVTDFPTTPPGTREGGTCKDYRNRVITLQ